MQASLSLPDQSAMVGADVALHPPGTFDKPNASIPHYRDGAPVISMPASSWSSRLCGCALSENPTGVAGVPSIKYAGKQYALNGALYSSEKDEGFAWELVPRALWAGVTFTYKTLIKAYENGTRYRGDARGLVVSVRGEEFVFAKFATFRDDRPFAQRRPDLACNKDAPDDYLGLDEIDLEGEESEEPVDEALVAAGAKRGGAVSQMALF